MHQHGANGDFTSGGGGAGFIESKLQKVKIVRHGNKLEKSLTHPAARKVCHRERFSIAIRRNHGNVPSILDKRAQGKETEYMKELVSRIFQTDFLKGMGVTFRTQLPHNIYTEQYPLERPMVAERFRGAPRLNKNPETGETLCIGCNLCALACPENLIVVGWERDDATRRKVLTTFTYDTSRCMFCGLCEDACPTDALELTQDFEMAYYSREGAIWDRHLLEEGPTPARYTR